MWLFSLGLLAGFAMGIYAGFVIGRRKHGDYRV